VGQLDFDIAFNTTSLVYGTEYLILHPEGEAHPDHPPDFLAFSVIVYLVVRSNVDKVPIPSLLRTIARDATYYFLVIFTSQFTFVMFVAFANVRMSPQSSILSLWLTYTFIAQHQTTPWHVSDTRMCFLRLFTESLSPVTVEISCTSEYFFAFQTIRSDPHPQVCPGDDHAITALA